jgi:hypothetical protein
VKLDKLAKQLHRDVAANPKKAAVLGLMALVALYFWAPLVCQWFVPKGSKRPVKGNLAALILSDDPAEPTAQAKSRTAGRFRWDKARQLIQQDPRMVSATFDATWVDPFSNRSTAAPPEAAPSSISAATAATVVGPQQVGLVLTSVTIGPRRRTATINGETYQENDVISAPSKDGFVAEVEFRLSWISPQGVKLERDGRTFQLELNKPKLAHGDQIERTKETRGD